MGLKQDTASKGTKHFFLLILKRLYRISSDTANVFWTVNILCGLHGITSLMHPWTTLCYSHRCEKEIKDKVLLKTFHLESTWVLSCLIPDNANSFRDLVNCINM